MQRQTRTLLAIAVIALVGVAALAMLANRYRRIAPTRSVHDLAAAPAPPAASTSVAQDVEAFRAARCALRVVMDRSPGAMSTIYREATQTTQGMDRVPMNTQLLIELRTVRTRALDAAGEAGAGYARTREAYRRWKKGTSSPEDADYSAEFERRKADLDACDLGELEVVDDLFEP